MNQTAAYTAGGVVPHRMGNAHPSVYPYEVMPTADRDVIITAANDRQFRALCEVLGIPEVADDERFRLNADRTANRAELHPLLLERLAEWSADDLFIALNKAGVPCGPINSIGEGVELAERLGLEPRVTLGEGGGAVDLVRNPIGFSAADVRYDRPPPALGEPTPRASGPGCRHRSTEHERTDHDRDPPLVPDRHRRLRRRHDHAAGTGPRGRPPRQGRLRRARLPARRPAHAGARGATVFEAVLVALADHGFTPTAIAARLTYLSAPDSIQGALAAGLLGGGSRFLGVTEDTAHFLHAAVEVLDEPPADDAGWDDVATGVVAATRSEGRFVPGLGHPVHKVTDPRTPVLMQLARDNGTFGPHLELFAAVGRVHPTVLGRTLPLNGAGVCGAVIADLDLPLGIRVASPCSPAAPACSGTSPRR